MELNIVLFEPEIPANTGNIARTCSATGTKLHLVHPLGFKLDDKHLKRAGLDYWEYLEVVHYYSLANFFVCHAEEACYFITKSGTSVYTEIDFKKSCSEHKQIFFIFGKETKGLPSELLTRQKHRKNTLRIPMSCRHVRSLNLSNTVAIVLYEALRQLSL